MLDNRGPIRAFSYLTVEKAPLYRVIMRVFAEARSRFALHLRSEEVVEGVRSDETVAPDDVEQALGQLCGWGVLERHPDTSDVKTVEQFYRPRFLYAITAEGEAVERALTIYFESIHEPGELQSAALADIRRHLDQLVALMEGASPDPTKAAETLELLFGRFEALTERAQIFVRNLQRRIDLHDKDLAAFLAYKDLLLDYLERFIQELVVRSDEIADRLRQLESANVYHLLELALERALKDRLEVSDQERDEQRRAQQLRWEGLRRWFIAGAHGHSQADELRHLAREAVAALLSVVVSIHERRSSRSDRAADYRSLARWFAEVDDDDCAHRLWRCVFALSSARHLHVDQETLNQWEESTVNAQASWLSAPPLVLAPRLRQTGRRSRGGQPASVIDRSHEKAALRRLAQEEARQIAEARRQLVTEGTQRLSDLDHLDTASFHLFLDLLGEALSRCADPRKAVKAHSSDGTLRIVLEPTRDGRTATIRTSLGELVGPDCFVAITPARQSANQRAPVTG